MSAKEVESNPNAEVVDPSKNSEGEEVPAAGTNFFSTSKPRDASDGLGKGLGNIAKGVFGGATMMVAAPIQGMLRVAHQVRRSVWVSGLWEEQPRLFMG